MSKNHTPPTTSVPAVPGPRPSAAAETHTATTDLAVLETLATIPVAEHLAIFEDIQASLNADLDATSKDIA